MALWSPLFARSSSFSGPIDFHAAAQLSAAAALTASLLPAAAEPDRDGQSGQDPAALWAFAPEWLVQQGGSALGYQEPKSMRSMRICSREAMVLAAQLLQPRARPVQDLQLLKAPSMRMSRLVDALSCMQACRWPARPIQNDCILPSLSQASSFALHVPLPSTCPLEFLSVLTLCC
jgi:hypothetical protein